MNISQPNMTSRSETQSEPTLSMANTLYTIKLSLTLQAPIQVQPVANLTNETKSKTPFHYHRPVLSGNLIASSIKRTLQHFIRLSASAVTQQGLTDQTLSRWFGNPSEPRLHSPRRQISLDVLWPLTLVNGKTFHSNDFRPTAQIRTTTNPKSGAPMPDAIQPLETWFASGSELTFEGQIRLLIDSSSNDSEQKLQLEQMHYWLGKALNYMPALGANKGVGFGRLLNIQLSEPQLRADYALDHSSNQGKQATNLPNRISLALTPLEPFCIAKPHDQNSHYVHADPVISGRALRGCLARLLSQQQLQAAGFENWRVQHAFPQQYISQHDRTVRPVPLPLSLVALGPINHHGQQYEGVMDLSEQSVTPLTINGSQYHPRFSADWKPSLSALIQQQWCAKTGYSVLLQRHARAADSTNQNQEDRSKSVVNDCSKEFTMEVIDPINDALEQTQERDVWLLNIDLDALDDSQKQRAHYLMEQLQQKELIGLGKTDSRFCLKHIQLQSNSGIPETFTAEEKLTPSQKSLYRVQLVTEARILLDYPDTSSDTNNSIDTQSVTIGNKETTASEGYSRYWDKVSQGCLELSQYFSQQYPVTGSYFKQLFHPESHLTHSPWLTAAGTVFLLKPVAGKEAQASKLLQKWLQQGLPQPDNNSDWKSNPWVKENGFGEIIINRQDLVPGQLYLFSEQGEMNNQALFDTTDKGAKG